MGETSWFLAELACPVCGTVSPADESTDLTGPFGEYGHTSFTVGDTADGVTWPNVRAYYAVLAEPPSPERFSFLETWTCPNCGSRNWARIAIADGIVAAIEAVPLTRATLEDANAITRDVEVEYWDWTSGEALFAQPDGVRERLLAAAPE